MLPHFGKAVQRQGGALLGELMMKESAFMVESLTVKQVPFPGDEVTEIFPLCISTISFVRCRPIPEPPSLYFWLEGAL